MTRRIGEVSVPEAAAAFDLAKARSDAARLRNAKSLSFSHLKLTELPPLNGLPRLRRFLVHNTWVSDLGPLSDVPSLRVLYIVHSAVQDLSPLQKNPHLTQLYL